MSAAELILATGSTPAAPAAGRVSLYADEQGALYCIGADGQPRLLATSTGDTLMLAGATLTAPRSGTLALKAGTPTAGRVAHWQDADVLAASSIRTGSSGAVGIGMEVAHDAAGNLDVAGRIYASGLVLSDAVSATHTLSIYTSGSTSATPTVVQATLDSNSDAVLVRCTLLLVGTANLWAIYTGTAYICYNSGTPISTAMVQPEQQQGTLQLPLLQWQSADGTTHTLTLQNRQTYSLLVAWVQVAARSVMFSVG